MKRLPLFVIIALSLTCCSTKETESFEWKGGKVWLDRISDTLSVIRFTKDGKDISIQPLPWPVYRFDWGDVDGDGIPEVGVGVIKKTPYWHQMDRRLFIYQLYKGSTIVPYWRGSHMASKLNDFYFDRNQKPAKIHTLETRRDSSKYEAEYYMSAFGPIFKQYIADTITTEQFNNHK